MERELNQNLSGNDVHYTNLIRLVKNMLCSELHCQKGFDSTPFHTKAEVTQLCLSRFALTDLVLPGSLPLES